MQFAASNRAGYSPSPCRTENSRSLHRVMCLHFASFRERWLPDSPGHSPSKCLIDLDFVALLGRQWVAIDAYSVRLVWLRPARGRLLRMSPLVKKLPTTHVAGLQISQAMGRCRSRHSCPARPIRPGPVRDARWHACGMHQRLVFDPARNSHAYQSGRR